MAKKNTSAAAVAAQSNVDTAVATAVVEAQTPQTAAPVLVELQPNQKVVTYKHDEATRAQKSLASKLSRERTKFKLDNPGQELPEHLQPKSGGGSSSKTDTSQMSAEELAEYTAFLASKNLASKLSRERKKFIEANPGVELPEHLQLRTPSNRAQNSGFKLADCRTVAEDGSMTVLRRNGSVGFVLCRETADGKSISRKHVSKTDVPQTQEQWDALAAS